MSGEEQTVMLYGAIEGERSRPVILKVDGAGRLEIWGLQVYRDAAGNPRVALVEADRTPRSQVVLWDHAGAQPIRAAAEPTSGQAMVSLYGWNGAALTQVLLEATGEQKNALIGADEAGNLDNFRTDPNRVPLQRAYDEWVDVAPVEIPVAEGDLWAPGLADAIRYRVRFKIVNNDVGGAAVTGVYIGRDVDAGGALAAPEYWMFNETIVHPGNSGWRGPFYMHGDDAVRGVAAVANDASIIWDVRRVDLGA